MQAEAAEGVVCTFKSGECAPQRRVWCCTNRDPRRGHHFWLSCQVVSDDHLLVFTSAAA